jgi:hypothetical protein
MAWQRARHLASQQLGPAKGRRRDDSRRRASAPHERSLTRRFLPPRRVARCHPMCDWTARTESAVRAARGQRRRSGSRDRHRDRVAGISRATPQHRHPPQTGQVVPFRVPSGAHSCPPMPLRSRCKYLPVLAICCATIASCWRRLETLNQQGFDVARGSTNPSSAAVTTL